MTVAAHTAVEESGVDAKGIEILDVILIREHRVMAQPALFLDVVLEVVGRVPCVEEIKGMLS